jgi:hypothetical protein
MRRRCEVCENFRPDAEPVDETKLVLVSFDTRGVLLCRGHARIAERSGVRSFEQLRDFYGKGRRSYVPRRAPADPDVLAEAGDRRAAAGRRATDLRS